MADVLSILLPSRSVWFDKLGAVKMVDSQLRWTVLTHRRVDVY